LIALGVALHEAFGLTSGDFFVRVNDRSLWADFLAKHRQSPDRLSEFLAIIDKLGRETEETTARKLELFGLNPNVVHEFIGTPADSLPGFADLFRELRWRGLEEYIELDLTIVRGLDYYTGLVFEFFDRKKENRSLAGGGRYDQLLSVISDGAVDLPAAGFAIGDVTFGHLLCEVEHTKSRVEDALKNRLAAFIVVADENRRENAIQLANELRRAGISVDYALEPAKVGKQFQLAEALGAARAIVVGQEWPQLRVKLLSDRTEHIVSKDELHNILAGI
jgi:histidyl-tRNA synthetase